MRPAFPIQLRPGSIENPTKLDVVPIWAAMLWPHDTAARDSATKAFRAAYWADEADQLDRECLLDLVGVMKNAPRMSEIHALIPPLFHSGLRAGAYLREAIGLTMAGERAHLQKIQHQVGTFALPTAGPITAATFRNVWSKFRPVAHLWGVSIHLNVGNQFPCRPQQLAEFVGLALGFRQLATQSRGHQSPETLLPIDGPVEIVTDVIVGAIIPDFKAKTSSD
jgi:hypothetical protein